MDKIAALSFSVFLLWSANAYSACQCLCSHFKTRGGEQKICARLPKGALCDLWVQQVPDIDSRAACLGLSDKEAICQGYAYKADRWTEVSDGRFHSCQFY